MGHIVGCHLPADIYHRFCIIDEKKTFLIGGTDEHGTATEVEAIKNKVTPEEQCRFFYYIHKRVYDWFRIKYDVFGRTSASLIHYRITQEIFLQMFKNRFFVEKKITMPYCKKCQRVLADRFIEGKCPYCGAEGARGDQCEVCCKLLSPAELIDPRCKICGSRDIEFIETLHLFLDFSRLEGDLRKWINSCKHWRVQVKNLALGWIKEGLKPRCITRDLRWGVPVPYKEMWDYIVRYTKYLHEETGENPADLLYKVLVEHGVLEDRAREASERFSKILDEEKDVNKAFDRLLKEFNVFEPYKDKVLYVWYDAPIGYLSYTTELGEVWKEFWITKIEYKIDKDTADRIIKVLGDVKKEEDEDCVVWKSEDYDTEIVYYKKSDEYWIIGRLGVVLDLLGEKVAESIRGPLYLVTYGYKVEQGSRKIIHFLGKDNIPFHTIFWPGMLLAFNETYAEEVPSGIVLIKRGKIVAKYKDGKIEGESAEDRARLKAEVDAIKYRIIPGALNLPWNVAGLQYLNYQGGRISKSKRWGVFCEGVVKSGLDADYWRFVLAFLIPERKDTDFTWEFFEEKINKELLANFGNFANRVLLFIWRNFNGEIPHPKEDLIRKDVTEKLKRLIKEYAELMRSAEIVEGLKKALEISDLGNKFFQDAAPWESIKEDPERCAADVCLAAYILAAAAVALWPFIPYYAMRVLYALGFDNLPRIEEIAEDFWRKLVGRRVFYPGPLFKKLTKEDLQRIKKIATSLETYRVRETGYATIEDLEKLGLRVGRVKSVEEHPSAEKLYILTIDLGREERKVVAGIKKWYSKEELEGKLVVLATNLEPKEIRGVLSEGMILAADDGKTVAIIIPEKEVKEGAKVR